MNSFVTQSKVSFLSLFILLVFLSGSNLRAAPATESAETRDIKSPAEEIQISPLEKAWLQEKHIVRIRIGNAPPLMFEDGGEIRGIAIDYINLIFSRNGIKFKYISENEVTWPEALEYIKKHEVVDMVPTAKATQKRKKHMLFTNAYIFAPWVIFTREEADFVSTINDLNGKTVSVQEGFVMHKKLEREYPEINLLVTSARSKDYMIKPIRDVAFGQADAFIGNLLITTYRLQKEGYTNVKVAAPTPFDNHDLSMGIRNDWPELVSIINKTLDSMTPEEHAAIRNKWLSMRFEYGISPAYVLKWVSGIIGVAALILVMILLWNRKLSREIQVRKKAEDALEKSESRFREMFEQSPFGIALIGSLTGHIYELNPKFAEISGRTVEEMKGIDWMSITHPDDVQEDLDNMDLLNAGKITGFNMDKRYIRPDSSHVWINMTIAPVTVEDKNHPRHLCMIDDITDQKRVAEALKESEEKFRGLAENNFDMIFSTDKEGNITYVSQAAERIFGFKPDEMAGNHFMGYLAKSEIPKVSQLFADAMQGMQLGTNTMEVLRKDGGSAYIELTASITSREDKVVGTQGVIRDVTEQRRLQDKLNRAKKMEAMGLMAGGVAHDLNNILSGIVSYPELLLIDLPEDSPMWKPIKTIQESGMRAADVVEDLLTIARGVASGREVLNLNTVIEEYLDSAEHQKLERIHPLSAFKTEIDSELLNITGSASHVKKILMNLVTNASEAIEGPGTVTVSTINRYLDEPLKGYEDVRTGEYVMLTVSDNGSGISPKDIDSIFEPFYTKKVMGRSGTGLGLAVVWNCMQDHDGYINVKSSEKGTIFELYFPTTREQVVDEGEQASLEDYLGHGEKVLVVDDEEKQREIASGILTRLGYNAEAVSSGEEAIEFVKENPLDLIVIDMVMPKGINGRETYEEIIKIRPDQKAIIASGYAKTKEVDLAQKLGAGKYIKKPYTLAKVGLAVKEELEK